MEQGRVAHKRTVSSTALIYCEGAHDLAFIRFLIKLYSAERNINTKFRAKQGKGGSPASLVIETTNVPGDFDRKLAKIDSDRTPEEIQKAKNIAAKNGIQIVWSRPCIEALLTSILDGKDYSRWTAPDCKRHFEKLYISKERRADSNAYAKLYTYALLEKTRKKIPELEEIISFITHNTSS